jgi:class 3 adenylate cyclase
MAAAGDGEILVTDAVREAVPSAKDHLVDQGRHELKGVPGEWQLFALRSAPTAGPE